MEVEGFYEGGKQVGIEVENFCESGSRNSLFYCREESKQA